jgi:hypothetical protein
MTYTERFGPAAERVSRGLATLNDDQIKLVVLDELEIADPSYCVLGQIFGSYFNRTAERLIHDLESDGTYQPGKYGFQPYDMADGRELTDEWVRQIRRRREEA